MAAKMRASAGDVWSKLPDELLSEVYGRIASPLHRVRFAAVCRSWRVVKSWQQPARTFPWLILSSRDDDDDTAKRVFCPADGELLRVSLPPEAIGKRLVGSHDGGWIAVTSNLAGEVPLPAKQTNTPWIKKTYLFMHDIHMTNEGNPVVSTLRILRTNTLPKFEGTGFNISYILKHGDKLLMAKRAWWSQENKGFFFKVFELVKTSNTRPAYGWTEVTTLDDHALFLSANCSRMVYQPAGRRGGVESNHIYYNNVNLIGGDKSIYNDVDLTRCDNGQHLYCGKDCKLNGVAMIMSVRYYVTSSHYNNLMWLLPPDL
uniref:KIB1-4 beta-propeller domain-containing protein n=1 Tax=Aegilops tauschii TaxID=37682 RepID=M8BEG5_AEGTA